jgi:hypothetical protein
MEVFIDILPSIFMATYKLDFRVVPFTAISATA